MVCSFYPICLPLCQYHTVIINFNIIVSINICQSLSRLICTSFKGAFELFLALCTSIYILELAWQILQRLLLGF